MFLRNRDRFHAFRSRYSEYRKIVSDHFIPRKLGGPLRQALALPQMLASLRIPLKSAPDYGVKAAACRTEATREVALLLGGDGGRQLCVTFSRKRCV